MAHNVHNSSAAAHPSPTPRIPPMQNPSAGSANPAASLPALWGYIEPALDHIVRSPSNNVNKAPAVDVEYHVGIHTAVYNYFTSLSDPVGATLNRMGKTKAAASGTDLYYQLDKYFANTCRELLAGAPQDDASLIHYLIPCFNRYSAGGQSVNRLLNYVNRHYVKRAVEEDKGWLRVTDVLDAVARSIREDDTREKIAKRLREERRVELKKWGFEEGGPEEFMTRAEASAEAASPLDRVVPLNSLAHRRFRTELVDPLLAVPKSKGRPKGGKRPPPSNSDKVAGPKGRLARAVKELIESKGGDEEARKNTARDLDYALGTVGIRNDHPLRKKLDKFAGTAISLTRST